MIEAALEAVVAAAAAGIVVLLAPRDGWSTEGKGVSFPWTGSVAVAVAAIVSLWLSEGSALFALSQRWHSLFASAVVAGVGGLVATVNITPVVFGPFSGPRTFRPAVLAITAFIAVALLAFPGHDGSGFRIACAASAAFGALILATPSQQHPRATGFMFAVSLGAMAGILASTGSLKVALAAAALALLCATTGAIAWASSRFSQGPAFAMASLVMLVAFGMYGMAYHDEDGVPVIVWWFVSLSPLVLIAAPIVHAKMTPSPHVDR